MMMGVFERLSEMGVQEEEWRKIRGEGIREEGEGIRGGGDQ